MNKIFAIISGGLDSVVLAHYLQKTYGLFGLHLLSFDYGQRHKKELDFAQKCAETLGANWDKIDLSALAGLLPGTSLTDNIDVPHGHYAAENMKSTIVPNRNPIMLSIACGIAAAHGSRFVATAVHGGDHHIYPDCRPDFIQAFESMEKHALEGVCDIRILTPFLHVGKHDIVQCGANLGVNFAETWSCYEGGALHCGKCGTCAERKEAFSLAGIVDPTEYAD